MQVKETVKDYINRAEAHDKLKVALAKARKTMEKISTLESLQKAGKQAEAHDCILKLYNELFDLHVVLELLDMGKWECFNDSSQKKCRDSLVSVLTEIKNKAITTWALR
jgi:hypothetical protein